MKRYDFTSFADFEESGIAPEREAVTLIRENGWFKADLMTECKSWKTAVNRFFKALENVPEFDGWKDFLRESAENGYFKDNDSTMADGSRNEFQSFAWEIEPIDESQWYIFLNIRPV